MASPAPHMAAAAGPTTTRSKKDLSLLVASILDTKDLHRVDLKLVDAASGAIVGKMDGQRTGSIAATGGLICHVPAVADSGTLRVLNPATGAVLHIPSGSTTTVHGRLTYVFGQVPNTVEYKVLRIYQPPRESYDPNQSCEILTLDGRGDEIWRLAPGPRVPVDVTTRRHRAVAQGFAHFLMAFPDMRISRVGDYDGIASFDLTKEEWRPSLLATPITAYDRNCNHESLSLVELNGRLVFVYHDNLNYCINMWMLEDLAKGKWLKMESVRYASVLRGWEEYEKSKLTVTLIPITRPLPREIFALPLMVLDDGCIVFWTRNPYGAVRVYDPKTRKCKHEFNMGSICNFNGLYKTGQLGFAL